MKYKNYAILFFTLCVGVFLSFLLFSWLHKNELEFTQEKFSQLINQYARITEHALEQETHSLNALAAYHYGSQNITADEFKIFASTLLEDHPNVQFLEWVPEVLHENKKLYEKDFHFKQHDRFGEIIPVQERSVYYPIYFLEPFADDKNVLGFDIGSEKNRLEALNRAKETKDVVASAPVKLIQAKEESAIAIFQPIYKQKAKMTDLIGFYINVVRIKILIENMISKVSKDCEGVNLDIYDVGLDNAKALVYSKECTCSVGEVSNVKAKEIIKFAGREWQFHASATKTFTSEYMTFYPYFILLISVMLSILMSFVFYQMQKGYEIVSRSNEYLRRFQKVAVGRERRISELKKENLELKNSKKDSDAR